MHSVILSVIMMMSLIILQSAIAADVSIAATGSVSAINKTTDDGNSDTTSNNDKYYQQLLYFDINGKADKNSQINARFSLRDGRLNGQEKTSMIVNDNDNNEPFRVDYAYITAPLLSITDSYIIAGRQYTQWGNCLFTCEEPVDRIDLAIVIAKDIKLSFFTDKLIELSGTTGYDEAGDNKDYNNDGDKLDNYNVRSTDNQDSDLIGTSIILPIGEKNKIGIIYMSQKNNGATYTSTNSVTPVNGAVDTATVETAADKQESGNIIDLFYNDTIGNIQLSSELIRKTGDAFETGATKIDSPSAEFLSATIPLGNNKSSLMAGILTTNRFATDDDFILSSMFSMFGGDANIYQTWGAAPAGKVGKKNSVADKTTSFLLGLDLPIGDINSININAAIGTYDNNDNDSSDKTLQGDIRAFELQFHGHLSKNATAKLFYGITSKSPEAETDTTKSQTNSAMGAKLEVKF